MTRIASQPALSDLPGRCPRLSLPDLTTLALGIALTVGFQGYQFGQSNHAVYLPPALHQFDPSLLRNDWFTTATLQYHTLFTTFSAALMRFHIIQPAFFISYFALVVLFHLAWLRLTWLLGGSRQTYALSVGLYYLSGAGLGLGMYQFLQDSAFLPSNIANVAMLWGVCFLAASRPLAAASTLGLASLFHLNHAVVAPLLWGFRFLLPPRAWRDKGGVFFGVPLFPSLLLLGVCAVAVGPILPRILARPQPIAFQEFIDLYVRLRHPHHYDPSSWPWYLWVAFLWPMPLAMGVYRRCPAVFRCGLFFACLQLLALLFAGLFYVSESVVQLSLYRFSIYVKLLSCIAAGYVIWDRFLLPRGRHPWLAQGLPASLLVFCMGILVFRQTWPMDLWPIPRDDKDYRALCQWARRHTPVDALFLVPPDEQSFRLHGQRAIVVNFKGVPQLSSELPEWRRRLESVLGMENLLDLPRGFDRTLREIRRRYDALSPDHLIRVAKRYRASYVVTTRPVDHPRLVEVRSQGRYHVYHFEGFD